MDPVSKRERQDGVPNRLAEHRDAIEAAATRYGLRPEILVAIWGLESNYGGNFGDTRTVDALLTFFSRALGPLTTNDLLEFVPEPEQ